MENANHIAPGYSTVLAVHSAQCTALLFHALTPPGAVHPALWLGSRQVGLGEKI